MQQSSAHWVIHAKTCPRPSWDPADVQQSSACQTSAIFFVTNHFNSQEMCFKAVKEDPKDLDIVPDHFKTQEMCDKTVSEDHYYLQYVTNCFVTSEQAIIWHENFDPDDDNEFIMWYNGYKKRKVWGKGYRKMIKEKVRSLVSTR